MSGEPYGERVPPAGGGAAAAEQPAAIWEQAVEEGDRRLGRTALGHAATGVVGGAEVILGVIAASTLAGALSARLSAHGAGVLGALVFGIGFVMITIGRSELFSENFLIPVSAVYAGRRSVTHLLRTWSVTLLANLVGLIGLAAIFSRAGVVDRSALVAVGHTADVLGARSVPSAFLSAVAAGIVMTLWTWLSVAARTDIGRISIALLIGFLLTAPVMNHVIVGTGEMMFGVIAGTSHMGWGDVWANFALALAGNLVGGIGFVTISRGAQVRGG